MKAKDLTRSQKKTLQKTVKMYNARRPAHNKLSLKKKNLIKSMKIIAPYMNIEKVLREVG